MKRIHNAASHRAARASAASALIAAIAMPALASVDGDPFADTKFHYLGGGRITAEGAAIVAGDFPDALAASDPSSALHGAYGIGSGGKTNDAIRLETVVCPFSGATLQNVPCLHFAQRTELTNSVGEVVESGGTPKRGWSTQLKLPELFPVQDQITAFLRFRWEGNPQTGSLVDYVLRCGYNWTYNIGYNFGIKGGDSAPVLCCFPGRASAETAMTRSNLARLQMAKDKWVEAAYVCSGTTLTFYMMCEGGTFAKETKTIQQVDTSESYATTRSVFGLGGGKDSDQVSPAAGTAWPGANVKDEKWRHFRGSIHEVAIWDRALTEEEVKHVFAGGRAANSLWRVGTRDGAAGEFTNATASAVAPSAGDWRGMRPGLSSGDPWVTLNYTLPHSTDATLPKRLFVASTPSSSAATLGISANGVRVGSINVTPGVETEFTIKTNHLAASANTLTLTLESGGPLIFDAMRLENLGWQIGVAKNGSYDGFSSESNLAYTHYWVDCPDWSRCIRSVKGYNDFAQTNSIHFALSPRDALHTRYRLTFAAWTENSVANIDPWEIRCMVNGTEKTVLSYPAYADGKKTPLQTGVAEFGPGELRGGENVAAFVGYRDGTKGWPYFDYFRLDAFPVRETVLIIR